MSPYFYAILGLYMIICSYQSNVITEGFKNLLSPSEIHDVSNTIFWNWIKKIENLWTSVGDSGLIKRSVLELNYFFWSIICNVNLQICLKTYTFNLTTLSKHLLTGVILAIESVISLCSRFVYYIIWLHILTREPNYHKIRPQVRYDIISK